MDLTYIPDQMGSKQEINKQINKQDGNEGDKGSKQGFVMGTRGRGK